MSSKLRLRVPSPTRRAQVRYRLQSWKPLPFFVHLALYGRVPSPLPVYERE